MKVSKTAKLIKKWSNSEALLAWQIGASLPDFFPKRQYRFCDRKWKFDFAWPDSKIACEVEGGTWNYRHGGKSRHTTGSGFENDCVKYSEAAILGWKVIRVTSKMVKDGRALRLIEKALDARNDFPVYKQSSWGYL